MRINADFSEPALCLPDDYHWADSPVPGVKRVMLDRIGDEVARATSIVCYAPNSEFPEHEHGGGEEIFVLDGEFADEHGRYPAGYYLRNPVGTRHRPRVGPEGARIFVKLHQFREGDTRQVALDTRNTAWQSGLIDGLQVMSLHQFDAEHVALVKWEANTRFQSHRHWGGEEIFVLRGTLHDEHGVYPTGTWLRSPHLSVHAPYTQDDGALIYVKTGHLGNQD